MSKTIKITLLITCISLLTISCRTTTKFDLVKARSQIEAQNAKYTSFYNNGDASGVAELHVDDAAVMPPNLSFS